MKKLVGLFLFAVLGAAGAGSYHVIQKIPLGGADGWDYLRLDNTARRLYVSNSSRVVVLDIDAGKVVGEIPDTQGVHGIALAPKLGRGFTSNGRTNNVTIFDLKTLKPLGSVATGENPDSILYDELSGHVFTFNGRSSDSTAFDAASGDVVGTIALGGKPEFSVTDGKGTIFVNIEDTHEVALIDSRKASLIKKYELTGCEEPTGLAIDTAHRRLFSVCGNEVMVVSDPDAGRVVATVPTGPGTDGAGFDPGAGYAFSSNGGNGTLTIVRESGGKYEVVENVETARGSRTMTVDEQKHRVYLPCAEFNGRARVPDSFALLVVGE